MAGRYSRPDILKGNTKSSDESEVDQKALPVSVNLDEWYHEMFSLREACYAPDYFGGNSINYPTLLNGYFSNKTLN